MYETGARQSPVQQRQLNLGTLVNSRVCRECNGGWMRKLEDAAESLIGRLFSGEPITAFTDREREVLARWTAKTAAVLSFVTPQQKHVPELACRSVHPSSSEPPRVRVFHCALPQIARVEGAYLQITYAPELPIIGSTEVSGTRIVLVLNNHALIADFPPAVEGFRYDLGTSIASQVWPVLQKPGRAQLTLRVPAPVNELLREIALSIEALLDPRAIRS